MQTLKVEVTGAHSDLWPMSHYTFHVTGVGCLEIWKRMHWNEAWAIPLRPEFAPARVYAPHRWLSVVPNFDSDEQGALTRGNARGEGWRR